MKKDIIKLYSIVNDFCKIAEEKFKEHSIENQGNDKKPTRISQLSISEIVTILLMYQQSPCKNFKYFYLSYLQLYKKEFPGLVSYNRFVELKKKALPYLICLLQWYMHLSKKTGISLIDATSINVCHAKRISSNKVFKDIGKIGKTTKGWFFGLKLHAVINQHGDLQGVSITPGNVDDRAPVETICKSLHGLLFGDKGYIKQELFEKLYAKGLKLITGIKKGMKGSMMTLFEKIMLKKRSLIESTFNVMKCNLELEHSRHRSPVNAFIHIISTLIAYSMRPNKPSIKSFL